MLATVYGDVYAIGLCGRPKTWAKAVSEFSEQVDDHHDSGYKGFW